MKSKKIIIVGIAILALTASLSACKSKCDCPTFSKTTPKTQGIIKHS